MRVVFSARAGAQLRTMYRYVARKAGEEIAGDYLQRVVQRCLAIAEVPQGGTPRDALGKGLRSVPYKKSATIFYRVRSDEIVIAAVLRRGQDAERQFGRR